MPSDATAAVRGDQRGLPPYAARYTWPVVSGRANVGFVVLAFAALPAFAQSESRSSQADEVNPPHPAAAALLVERARCIRHAREVGEALLAAATETATGSGTETETDGGLTCTSERDLYSGDAGVALFLAHLHAATGEQRWLEAARRLLDHALALDRKADADGGLYTGTAGVGQACLAAYGASKDPAFLERAKSCAERLPDQAAASVTDVISGAAGTGSFLLDLHAATGDARHLAQARRAGDYLVAKARREGGRASWGVSPGRNDRVYLGLSHGAAGVASFLLRLHRATGEAKYRALAEEGMAFVLAHAEPEGESGAKWLKMVAPFDERRNPYAVQWCHGSPGIGLVLCEFERDCGPERYRAPLDRCLAATRAEGRTARVGGCRCHGVSGNAELFLEAYRLRHDAALLVPARLFASALLEAHDGDFRVATRIGRYRYPPGYMLGLAGIGDFFLRLAAVSTPAENESPNADAPTTDAPTR